MEPERRHLTSQEREAYLAGSLAPGSLLSADRHVQACEECMSLLNSERTELPVVHLSDIADVDDEHLSFEQLSGHVDEVLDPVEASIVALHLEDCESCRREVAALVAVRDEITAEKPLPVPHLSSSRRTKWLSWKLLVPVFGAGAVVVALWLLPSGLAPLPEQEAVVPSPLPTDSTDQGRADIAEAEPKPSPNEIPMLSRSIIDGHETVGLNERGELVGLTSVPVRLLGPVRTALSDGAIKMGEGVDRSGRGVLMGRVEGVPFTLKYPVGEVMLSPRPSFKWGTAEGASAYRVKVFDEGFNEVASSPELKVTQWTPPAPLARGRQYRWQVTAVIEGVEVKSPERPAPDAVFRIVDAAAAEDLQSVRKKHPNSNLLLGIAYARAGMRREAEREFNVLLRRNPNNEIVRKLLREVRGGR